jgi:hypothetical protein
MELPIEIQRLINDYARPMTRPDWRKGSYYNRATYIIYYKRSYYNKKHKYTFDQLVRCLYIFRNLSSAYHIYEINNNLIYGPVLT